MNLVEDYKQANVALSLNQAGSHQLQWQPPPEDFVKVNTDMANFGRNGIGFGVVIHDFQGTV